MLPNQEISLMPNAWFCAVHIIFHWFSLIYSDLPWWHLILTYCQWFSLYFQCFFLTFHWFSLIFTGFHWFSAIWNDRTTIFIDFERFSTTLQRFFADKKQKHNYRLRFGRFEITRECKYWFLYPSRKMEFARRACFARGNRIFDAARNPENLRKGARMMWVLKNSLKLNFGNVESQENLCETVADCSISAHRVTGRSHVPQDHFWTPPNPQKGYEKSKNIQKDPKCQTSFSPS